MEEIINTNMNISFFSHINLPGEQKDVNTYIHEVETKLTNLQSYLQLDLNKKSQKQGKSNFLTFINNKLKHPKLTYKRPTINNSISLTQHNTHNGGINKTTVYPRLKLSNNLKNDYIKVVNMTDHVDDSSSTMTKTIPSRREFFKRSYSRAEGSDMKQFNTTVSKIINNCSRNAKHLEKSIYKMVKPTNNPFASMIKDAIDVKGVKKKREDGFYTIVNGSIVKLVTENKDHLFVKTEYLTKLTEKQSYLHKDVLMKKFGMTKEAYIDYKMDKIENDHFKMKRLHRELKKI
jgi:hypothetical protein